MRKHIKLTKGKASTALTLTAFLLCLAVIGAVNTSGEQNPSVDQNYGIPDNAMQYNRTDTTPVGQMEQVRSMETYVVNYRNLTLALNCTRNCEFNVTMDPALKPKVLSLSIEPNQNMSLTMNMTGTPSEAEMVRTQTLNFYLGLEPNATLELQAQIRLHINQTELSQELNREVNASRLTWQYYNATEHQWVTVPSWIDQNNYLVCNTTHFSTWTVAELSDQTSPQPQTAPTTAPTQTSTTSTSPSPIATLNPTIVPTQTAQPSESQSPSPSTSAATSTPNATEQKGLPVEYLYIGAGFALAAIIAVSLLVLKRRKQ